MNILENSNLIKLISDPIKLALKSYKFILASTLVGLLLGIIYSTTLTPRFQVTAVIAPNELTNTNASPVGVGQMVKTLTGSSNPQGLDPLFDVIFTYPTAKILWEAGYDKIFFGDNYDPEKDKFLIGEPTFSDIFSSWVLGYDLSILNEELTPTDLKGTLDGYVLLKIPRGKTRKALVYSLTSNPELAKKVIVDLLMAADQTLKDERIIYAESQINFIKSKLETVNEVEVRRSLIDSMKKQYLEIALASSDLPYSMRIVEPPQSSPTFVSPNLQFIYYAFSFLGFVISIIFLYIRSLLHKDSS
tara:strand:+ start:13242 stop:14150 length:909 start_codon:yes stop_codon:yes gene_type:complete